jgi:hypothetical protein
MTERSGFHKHSNFGDGPIFGHFVGFRWQLKNGWEVVGWVEVRNPTKDIRRLNPTYE